MVKGIVSRFRFINGRKRFTVTDGKADHGFFSREHLELGAAIVVTGEMRGDALEPSGIVVLSGEEAKEAYKAVEDALAASLELPSCPQLVKDSLSEKLGPLMQEAARTLIGAKKLGRSVMLRFHGDADGISGAFALTSVTSCKASQQNSAIYGVRDALRDMSTIGQESRPLVVLLDFGSNDASAEGLRLLEAAGIEHLIIDHHPPGEKPPEMVSPYCFPEGESRYTAGYLACEIAVACGMDKERALDLARIACSGDKSDLIENGDAERRKAMVLDYLAAHVSFGNNLDFYKKVMDNAELFSSIAQQADESIEEAAQKAMQRMRREGVAASFPLEGIIVKGEWPSASKVTTRVFEKLSGEEPLLCIGYTERSVIMRLNQAAADKGFSANDIAKSMKESMADFVEGGGGHVKAGAIRARKGFSKDIVSAIIKQISPHNPTI